MSAEAETLLSDELRSVACRSGNEWGWQPEKIPLVIDEAERLSILNIGGQLQFLMPHATCECYWVEVDALRGEPEDVYKQSEMPSALVLTGTNTSIRGL